MKHDLAALARKARFFPLPSGGIVYLGQQKKLYGLNAPAALIWQDLAEDHPPIETLHRLKTYFSLDADTAQQWRELALSSFAETILKEAGAAEPVSAQVHRQAPPPFSGGAVYRFFGHHVRIAAPPEALARIETLIGHLRETDAPGAHGDLWIFVTAEDDGFRVSSGGDPSTLESADSLAADVERRIVQDIVPRASHFLAFHGALLVRDDTALLLTAPSGSGKTTLAITLAKSGWSLLTDELALLDRDLSWRGLPLRPCVKCENHGLIGRLFPQLDEAMEHVRFGRRVKFLPLPVASRATALKTVIFPQFVPDAAARMQLLDPAEGLQKLLSQCIYVPPGFEDADVARLIDWHDQAEYHSLVFGDAQAAANLLHDLSRESLRHASGAGTD